MIGDPQQRQHVVLGILIVIAGIAELFFRAGRMRREIWRLAWPAAVIVSGMLFIVHVQHGPREAIGTAVLLHRVLGTLLIATGLLRVAEISAPPRRDGCHSRGA